MTIDPTTSPTATSATATSATATKPARRTVQLDVQGMTCASCAQRIERKLNRLDGVEATVNYATEKASVRSADIGVDLLISTIHDAGYGASLPVTTGPHPETEIRALGRRVIVSAALSAPVIATSMLAVLQFPGWQWLAFTLTLPVVLWAGWPFHRAALVNLRHANATMDTLISIGTLASTGWSAYALIFGPAGMIGFTHPFSFQLARHGGMANLYLEAAVAITTFLLLGRYLEARAKRRSGAALRALMDLVPPQVAALRGGTEVMVDLSQLRVGEHFVVRPGERVATDAVVVSGHSAIDTAMISGEPVPVEVGPGNQVVGGCVNTHGRLVVEATKIGADTQLAQITALVTAAQSGKARVQRLADRISGIFVPIVIILAVATLIFWVAQGADTSFAFTAAVAVLIIACPCALGLATPTALLVGTGRGAQHGILIKGPEALESASRLDTVVLDKTGTVTEGRMAVVAVIADRHPSPRRAAGQLEGADEVVTFAGAAEAGSEHPIARAITAYARTTTGSATLPAVDELTNRPGHGVVATMAGRRVVVGRPGLLVDEGLAVATDLRLAYAEQQELGRTAVLVGWGDAARGVLAVADPVKPTSAEAVRRLRALGLRPVLLTGDHRRSAEAVAAAVGIDEVIAEVLPVDKVAQVRRLQASGARVAMIGDGVNDAAALAQAELGIALGTGTDAAIEASDLTLVSGDLRVAADAIRLARATLRTIRTNLFWAFAYNVAALPLAAAGFLNPMFAGAAMAASSVLVVGNSLRLRRFR